MVHHDDQHVLMCRQREQVHPPRQLAADVKTPAGLGGYRLTQVVFGGVRHRQDRGPRVPVQHDLPRDAVGVGKDGAQAFVRPATSPSAARSAATSRSPVSRSTSGML